MIILHGRGLQNRLRQTSTAEVVVVVVYPALINIVVSMKETAGVQKMEVLRRLHKEQYSGCHLDMHNSTSLEIENRVSYICAAGATEFWCDNPCPRPTGKGTAETAKGRVAGSMVWHIKRNEANESATLAFHSLGIPLSADIWKESQKWRTFIRSRNE